MKSKGTKSKIQLRWSMVMLMVTSWLVPIIIIIICMLYLITGRLNAQVSNTVSTSANKAVQNIEMQLDECRNASRNASYFSTIADSYGEYMKTGEKQKLYDDMTLYLAQQYRYIRNANSTILFFTDEPELLYSTYSTGYNYNSILDFKNYGIMAALAISDQLDTDIWFYECGGLVYMIRNIMDASYDPYAMIVLELNMDYLTDSLTSVWGYEDCGVYLNGVLIYGDRMDLPAEVDLNVKTPGSRIVEHKGAYYVYHTTKQERQYLSYVIRLDSDTVLRETQAAYYVLFILLLSMIPLIFIIFRFFKYKVTIPVDRLTAAAEQITGGNYGYEITDPGNSAEFGYLNRSFNGMSHELKHQFEQIYLEELALKDANIKALQSQINPHFLNNTLEVINWEARMNGADRVSSMIEALSTMLNATLNRRDIDLIRLSEEMEYVDAYLYIISERMGSKLTVTRHIEDEVLNCEVPRLIIQPIIENAVEHGVKITGRGSIELVLRGEADYIYVEVFNSGTMTEQDRRRVAELLSPDNTHQPERSVSIGIRNVNKRLRLIYGDDCGLTITTEGDRTVSRLKIRRKAENV